MMNKLNFTGLPPDVARFLKGEAIPKRIKHREVAQRFASFLKRNDYVINESSRIVRNANLSNKKDEETADNFIELNRLFNDIQELKPIVGRDVQSLMDYITGNSKLIQQVYSLPQVEGELPPVPQAELDLANSEYRELLTSAASGAFSTINDGFSTALVDGTRGFARMVKSAQSNAASLVSATSKAAKAVGKNLRQDLGYTGFRSTVSKYADDYSRRATKAFKFRARLFRKSQTLERKQLQSAKTIDKVLKSHAESSSSALQQLTKDGGTSSVGMIVSMAKYARILRLIPALLPALLAGLAAGGVGVGLYKFFFDNDNPDAPSSVEGVAASFGLAGIAYKILRHPIKFMKSAFSGFKAIIGKMSSVLSKTKGFFSKMGGKILGPIGGAWGVYDGLKTLWNAKEGQGFFSGGLNSRAFGYGSAVAGGATIGATIGSVVPGVGTVVGGVVGGAIGGISALVADNKEKVKSFFGMQKKQVSEMGITMSHSTLGVRTKQLSSALTSWLALSTSQSQTQSATPSTATSFSGTATQQATSMLKQHEGFSSSAYWDVNHYRVGYGSDTITRADGSVVSVRKGMTVTRHDAERDLNRRAGVFMSAARNTVGAQYWDRLPPTTQAVLTSVAYNYGSLTKLTTIVNAARSGNIRAIADAVRARAGDNGGINRNRRNAEADAILASVNESPSPVIQRKTSVPIAQEQSKTETAKRKTVSTQGKTALNVVPFMPSDNRLVGSNIVGL